ncbi:type 1 glutamine amidotransferase [Halococcoides cellulosivorans]|uniref:GMP synthase n=1 Tax=Halococcoides cellulosivorans TaxID=1679096 RepID=A0A2R4WZD1_9EURY|nr:type 1 glutamine amidotransferase [Halococcoides cellulosivorans]AWB26891.1 GMP synthase [Halococcoides cellulosivorans]
MDRPRLALLNAAHEQPDTRQNFERELDADLDVFHCPSGEFPDGFQYDGVVITGSSASVYWDEEWIGATKVWVGDAIRAGLPALGVCFGHQLVADVMGGSVKGMGEYELGYQTVNQDGSNRLLDEVDETMTVFMSHSDHVTDAPPGATVFARNEYGIQGFRNGHAFGVQFHPEYDMETAETITRGKSDQLTAERIERVLDEITVENYAEAREVTTLFDNFVAFVNETQRKRIEQ